MIPLRSQVGFSATQQNHRPIIPHEVHHDHNYGEPRRHHVQPLSRHQRNVDELENHDERESLSSRLRHRTLVNNSSITPAPTTNGVNISPRRPTRSTRLLTPEHNSDSEDDNTPLLNIVASSSRLQTPSNTRSGNQRSLRHRRQIGSDEDQVRYIKGYCFMLIKRVFFRNLDHQMDHAQ